MEDKIVLKDGTEIEGGKIAPSTAKQIYISIPGTDLVSAVQTFANPEKTEEMVYYYGVYKKTYKGYTQLDSAGVNPDGTAVNLYLNGDDPSIDVSYTVAEQYLPEAMRNNK